MNYFNYFTEIEDTFVRRRGKHLLLSPMDWALIESWKEMKVPLHIALRGIERAFDSWEAKPRKRSVKSLLYCQEEVEAQFAEWLEAHVGSEAAPEEPANSDTPFARSAITDHLQNAHLALTRLSNLRRDDKDDLTEALDRVATHLQQLKEEFESTATRAQTLETSLTGLERLLNAAMRSSVSAEQMAEFEKSVKSELKPYRNRMDQSVFQQTFDNLLLKRLREHFGIPRLSLFYL